METSIVLKSLMESLIPVVHCPGLLTMVESGVLASRMEDLGSEMAGLMLRTAVGTPINFLEDLAVRIDRWLGMAVRQLFCSWL